MGYSGRESFVTLCTELRETPIRRRYFWYADLLLYDFTLELVHSCFTIAFRANIYLLLTCCYIFITFVWSSFGVDRCYFDSREQSVTRRLGPIPAWEEQDTCMTTRDGLEEEQEVVFCRHHHRCLGVSQIWNVVLCKK